MVYSYLYKLDSVENLSRAFTKSWNIWSWKGLAKEIKSKLCFHTAPTKIQTLCLRELSKCSLIFSSSGLCPLPWEPAPCPTPPDAEPFPNTQPDSSPKQHCAFPSSPVVTGEQNCRPPCGPPSVCFRPSDLNHSSYLWPFRPCAVFTTHF